MPVNQRSAALKALDRAHHLHPVTDHKDLGGWGTCIIEQPPASSVTAYPLDGLTCGPA
jgi:hypothetical protein